MLKITVVRKEYNEDCICDGEIDYSFIDIYDENMTIKELIDYLKYKGYSSWEPSDYPRIYDSTWIQSDGIRDYATGEYAEISLHNADKDKSKRWLKYLNIARKLGYI